MAVGIVWWLSFSAILFALGVLGILTQTNAVRILMSVELLFNAANINFVVFSSYYGFADQPEYSGWLIVFFSIAIAAAEAAVGISIFMNLSRFWGEVNVRNIFSLREDHPEDVV